MENQTPELNDKKDSKGANNTIVRILIIVIIILVLGLVYAFAFQDKQEEKSNLSTNATNSNQNNNSQVLDNRAEFKTTNENTEENKDEKEAAAEQDPNAVSRDEQRIADIKRIQEALVEFKSDRGNYPEKMEELAPDYLSEIPKNPTPGGIDYIYTPIGALPAQYYDLAYELEVGTSEVKDAGTHIANPEGIANI